MMRYDIETSVPDPELALKLTLSLLNHLMIYGPANPHSKTVWLPEVGWVCACGLAIKWDPDWGYVPK